MKLLAMSSNNKFFLFEDQMSSKPKFGIYQIKSDSDENIFEHLLEKVANIRKKYSENYFFEEFYEIDFFSSKLIIHLQEKQGQPFTLEQLRESIEEENIRIKVTDSGKVILICNLPC